jgi:hypothetical protein
VVTLITVRTNRQTADRQRRDAAEAAERERREAAEKELDQYLEPLSDAAFDL